MKKIEAIVRPERVQPVVEALEAIGILGLNVTQVTGRGRQKGVTVHTGRGVETTQVNMLPKARVEVVVADADVDKVIAAVIRAADQLKGRRGRRQDLRQPGERRGTGQHRRAWRFGNLTGHSRCARGPVKPPTNPGSPGPPGRRSPGRIRTLGPDFPSDLRYHSNEATFCWARPPCRGAGTERGRCRRRSVAQLVEQRSPKPQAGGSNPLAPASSQASAPRGRGFDRSLMPRC